MTSCGNEVESWTQREAGRAGQLVGPVISPENDHHLSAVKSLGSTDHPLHLAGRADSAYSSFSGGSNAPEHPTPSGCGECCCLPPEQVPYMDLEYVRGIYNVSAAPPELRAQHPPKAPALGSHPSPPSSSLTERCGIPPTQGTSNLGALAAPAPSPPSQLGSCSISRHPESSGGGHSSGGHSERDVQPGVQDRQLADRDVLWSQHWDGQTEPGTRTAREKTLENKGLSSDSANEVSASNIQGLKAQENGEWSPCQQPTKRSNPHIFSRPSSFIFQEYLKTDSVANIPKILSAYNSIHANKMPKELNSKACPPAHSKPSTVNDTQEVKQCPCGVQKPSARGAALPSPLPGPSQRKGSWPCAQDLLCAQGHPDMDQDVFEDTCDLKYMENALLIKNASRKLNSCTAGNQHYDCEGKTRRDVRDTVLSQQGRVQRSSGHEGSHQGRGQCWDSTSHMAFLRLKEDSTSWSGREVQKGKQAHNSSAELSTCLEHEEPPAQKAQPGSQAQLSAQDRAGGHITRQVTPMLYYLSRGKATNPPHPNKPTRSPEGSGSSLKETPSSSYTGSARGPEGQRGHSHHHGDSTEELLLHTQELSLGGPASLTEESFKNDYREKLKVAQTKVLRETSFKRRDLQMSLPVRLRQKPSKRSSIEHLRSFSLSSASEDAKPVPCSPSHLESLQSFSRDEIRRPQTGQAGERKRVTKEEKKLCYSEPEKLDQLMDKEVLWSQVRDEITEQDVVGARRRALENGRRALSSSGISRTELKQIQHIALMEYMERKINQRPGAPQHLPLQKPPLQKRLSHPSGPPGKIPNPEAGRKMQNDEVFCQDFSGENSADVFPACASLAPLGVSSRCSPSPAPAAKGLPQAGAPVAGTTPGTSESTPPSTRAPCRCASGATVPAQRPQGCASPPSFHDAENRDHNARAGHACCQDTEELTPESSTPTPGSGSRESTPVEEGCRTQALGGNAALKHPEQGMYLHTTLAQPLQGDKNAAKGSVAQDDVPLEGGTHLPRRRLQCPHDQRCQELVLEIIAKDRSLVDILMPHPDRKTALDLMEGLFPVNVSMLEKSHRKKGNVQHVQENDRKSQRDGPEECPEHEAKQRSKDDASKGNQVLNRSRDSTDDLDDITSKKVELMGRLQSRLQRLWEEREQVLQECRQCAELGQGLEATLRELCKPNEFQRYLMFIGDLEKVVSLLLCLSSRLARVQNALSRVDGSTDAEEKHSLSERHKLLCRQREDAKDLKENLDRRERVVSAILAKYLTEQQLHDYRHFVQAKTSLLIEQKDLEEQIKFCEEQLETLERSLPP